MLLLLKSFFAFVFLAMVAVTLRAAAQADLWSAAAGLWPDWWFRATLADAYFGFLTFFAWVAYKERGGARCALWLALILAFGNLAMSAYVLRELFRLRPGEPLTSLLLRRAL